VDVVYSLFNAIQLNTIAESQYYLHIKTINYFTDKYITLLFDIKDLL